MLVSLCFPFLRSLLELPCREEQFLTKRASSGAHQFRPQPLEGGPGANKHLLQELQCAFAKRRGSLKSLQLEKDKLGLLQSEPQKRTSLEIWPWGLFIKFAQFRSLDTLEHLKSNPKRLASCEYRNTPKHTCHIPCACQ